MIKQTFDSWFGGERLEAVLSSALLIYLAVYFLVPYKPWTLPVSLHTPLLLLGLGLAGARLLARPQLKELFSGAVPFFLAMLVFFLASSLLVHADRFSMSGFQAYLLSFFSFLFVLSAARYLDLGLFYAGLYAYLGAAGLLILLQVTYAGPFYVSGFLGHYGFGYTTQGWGFVNSATLSGGVMSWCFSVALARYSFSGAGERSRSKDIAALCAVGFGAVGLFYTISLAAWAGSVLAAACVLAALFLSKSSKKNFMKAMLSVAAFITVFCVFHSPEVYKKREKLLFFFRFLFDPKLTVEQDTSVNTRAQAWGLALKEIEKAPVWGIGLDQFPALYHQAYPALSKSANGNMDLNQAINPHNSYLYYAVEVGALPTLFLLLLIGRILLAGLKAGRFSEACPFLIGLVAVCLWTCTNDYLKERIFWIVLALTAGLAFPERARTK